MEKQKVRYNYLVACFRAHSQPFDLIQSLKKRLNKGGKIFIAIPNFKSFDSKYYGKYWAGYDTPRHLWHFSRESIRLIAKKIITRFLRRRVFIWIQYMFHTCQRNINAAPFLY